MDRTYNAYVKHMDDVGGIRAEHIKVVESNVIKNNMFLIIHGVLPSCRNPKSFSFTFGNILLKTFRKMFLFNKLPKNIKTGLLTMPSHKLRL